MLSHNLHLSACTVTLRHEYALCICVHYSEPVSNKHYAIVAQLSVQLLIVEQTAEPGVNAA